MIKSVRLKDYKYNFDTDTGMFVRWGQTLKDDPILSPVGPELADIEISTICSGINGTPCSWCYKSNTHNGENMSLETFAKIVNLINCKNNLTQIALGVGDVDANPDFVKILKWCRKNKIVPNLTVNGARLDLMYLEKTYAEWISELCGAVAVSHYTDNLCFDAISNFKKFGMKYVNIHQILSEETIDDCIRLVELVISGTEERLEGLNAIIFLSLKQKGSRNNFHVLTDSDKYKTLVSKAIDNNVTIGFDSCGSKRFLKSMETDKNIDYFKLMIEPCEADLFSFYVNVKGVHFPCSFCENENANGLDWACGINLLEVDDFMGEVWNNPKIEKFRKSLIDGDRKCPMFEV